MAEDTSGYVESESAQSPARRTLRGTWFARHWPYVVAVVAVLAALCLAPTIVAKQSLGRELARLRAAGEPLSLADIAPPKTAAAVNTAAMYTQAFGALKDPAEIAQVRLFLSTRPATPSALKLMAAIIARHQPEFDLLDRASRSDSAHFPVDWNAGGNALFPHMGGMRNATRFLTAKALLEARRGDSGQALADFATATRMCKHINQEPTLISQLVKAACVSIMFGALPRVLEAAPPNAPEARAFYDAVGEVDMTAGWVRAMQGERALGMWGFDAVRHLKTLADLQHITGSTREEYVPGLRRMGPTGMIIARPMIDLDEAYYLRYMRRLIEIARLPPPQSKRGLVRLHQQFEARAPSYAILTKTIAPVFTMATDSRDRTMATLAVMQAAMALRAYQIEHGAYPTSLAALQKAGGWKVPNDPCTDRPLIYRRQGAGYLIHSLGTDGKDDGGIDLRVARDRAALTRRRGPGDPPSDIPLKVGR